jgi:hypothetical protein
MIRDPAPWLALALTLADRLRPSEARRGLLRAARADLRAEGPRPARALGAWQEGAARAVRDLPDPPALPGVEPRTAETLTLLHATHAALAEVDHAPATVAHLAALIAELEAEIRGAMRWDVSVHAVDRYQGGVDPEATEAEARATLYRAASTATRVGRARDCAVWVSPEVPGVQLLVRDSCVVTVTTVSGAVARADRARWVA